MNSRADGLPARTAPSGRGLVLALGLAATVASSPAVAAAPSDLSGGVGAEDVVGLALSHNPSLRAALLDVQSARVAVAGEEARYPFTLQVDTGVTRTESPSLGYGGGTEVGASSGASASVGVAKHLPWGTDLSLSLEGSWELTRGALSAASPSLSMGPGYLLGLRFAVTQPLLRGYGRDVNEAALQQATAQRSSAEVARDRTASELLRNALVGYWELWYAHAALDIERQSLELSKEQRDEAATRLRTGSLAPADLLGFETSVATQEEALLGAEVERSNRATELAELLGQGALVLGPPLEEPPVPESPPAEARRWAEAESTTMREAERAVELARVQARSAADSLRPKLDLDASLQAQGLGNRELGGMFEQLGTLGAVSGHVGMTYQLPLDDTAERSAAARAQLAVEQAMVKLEQTRQSIRASVETELRRGEASRRRLELSQRTAGAAESQLSAAHARLGTGSATALAVLQAEQDLRGARLRVARARVDLVESDINLAHLTGRLLGRYGVRVDGLGVPAAAVRAPASNPPGGSSPAHGIARRR
jgi:outer membrane protein